MCFGCAAHTLTVLFGSLAELNFPSVNSENTNKWSQRGATVVADTCVWLDFPRVWRTVSFLPPSTVMRLCWGWAATSCVLIWRGLELVNLGDVQKIQCHAINPESPPFGFLSAYLFTPPLHISACPAQSQVEDHISQLDSGASVRLGLHGSCEAGGQICPIAATCLWVQIGAMTLKLVDKQPYAHEISQLGTLQGKKSLSYTQTYHIPCKHSGWGVSMLNIPLG